MTCPESQNLLTSVTDTNWEALRDSTHLAWEAGFRGGNFQVFIRIKKKR
jgi:hypothetical protein